MKSLGDYIKEKSQFISIEAGKNYSAVYRGYKFIEKEVRGETKEYVRYLLEDLQDHQVRTFDSQSLSLAKKMEAVPIGAVVKIAKEGEGFDTKYKVEYGELKEKKMLEVDEIPVIEDEAVTETDAQEVIKDFGANKEINPDDIPF